VAAFIIINIIVNGKFLTLSNIRVMIQATTAPTLVGFGFLMVFTGNITDLSPGSIIIVASTTAGLACVSFGPVAMLVVGILTGIACVVLNFSIYRITKVPPWIAGLGMAMVYEAIIGAYAGWCAGNRQKVVTLTGDQRIFGMEPGIYIILVAGIVIAYILYNRTNWGVNYRAVGDNEDVAKIMGIHITKTIMLAGVAAGFFFGFAAVVKEGYAGFTNAASGLTSLSTCFQPIAAVLLAMALSGIINVVFAVPLSCFLIVVIFNVLTLMGVPSGTFQDTLLGIILIVFAIFANRKTKGVVK
jgi:ribose transport system permease protein